MATTTSSTSTSSSVLQALGLGSGLDIQSLVSSLTEAEMSAANNRAERQQESVTTQVSAVASMKSALSVFQASLLSLTTGTYSSRSATSGDEEMLTVSANSDAIAGNYRVEIEQLASAQQLLSTTVFSQGRDQVVGTGELTLSIGSDSFKVTLDSSNSTLADIRDAINDAEDNTGISAALVYGTDGSAQLMLSSTKTGAGNEITIAAAGGDGGLDQLAYSASNTANFSEEQASQDAVVYVSGVKHESSSNTISDAVDGITLNLLEAEPGTEITVKVANNTGNMVSLVQTLVDAYNTLNQTMSSLGSYDSSTQTAGALLGDSTYNNVQRQLSHALRDQVSGLSGGSLYSSLSGLGITTTASGSLTLDMDKLTAALNSDYEAVAAVLQSDNGVISRVNSFLDEALSSGGAIAARDASLDSEQEQIDDLKDWIEMRTAQVQARYLAKFNAMDSLLAQLNNTSEYLTQTFDALTKDSD